MGGFPRLVYAARPRAGHPESGFRLPAYTPLTVAVPGAHIVAGLSPGFRTEIGQPL